jgi:hypothetical protein
MGRTKQQLIDAQEQWFEDMPDLMGQALADAEREFLAMQDLDRIQEAADMPLWIQLELDLWEGQHGINEASYWDVAGRGSCEVRN